MMPWLPINAAVCSAALVFPHVAFTQQADGTSSVIVVFHAHAPFTDYRDVYRADERMRADPEAWQYLDPGVVGAVQTLERRLRFRAEHVYGAALHGFATRLTSQQLGGIVSHPMVAYVEPDGIMTAKEQVLPWGIDRIDTDVSSTKTGDGSGVVSNVDVYIIDTGISLRHADLNVVRHVRFNRVFSWDCNGHGTHVAGIAAAIDNTRDVVGAAPGASLIGLKVLDCHGSGTTSGVIKAVDWLTANAVRPSVANMSLSGDVSRALDDAVINSANSGIFYAVAAGNGFQDACHVSPARAGIQDGVMTVAATDIDDQEAFFSNFGNCVDIWAPGVQILSTALQGGVRTLSGTSMAAPHVAGTAALYLSWHPSASPAEVERVLKGKTVSTGTISKDGRAISIVFAGDF